MSYLNNMMVKWLGMNWKTTFTGWASALMSLAALLSVVTGANGGGQTAYWIAVACGVLSALAKVLNGLVAADAEPIQPPSSASSGFALQPMLWLVAMIGLLVIASGCMKTVSPNIDATDGKILGIVPDEFAAPFAGKLDKRAEAWLNQQAGMAKLVAAIPEGTPLNYGIRLKGTEDAWIDLADYEQVIWLAPVVKPLTIATPDFGSRVRPTPVLSPKPSPAVPVASSPPPVAGGGAVGVSPNSTLTPEAE